MLLFLSQPDLPEVFGSSIIGPGTYRLQLDLTFGVSAPLWTGDRRKVNALGDVIIPLPSVGSGDPAAPLLNSRSVRVGIGGGFWPARTCPPRHGLGRILSRPGRTLVVPHKNKIRRS